MSGNDVFVSLPTWFGKSLIYGLIPPVINRLRGHTRTTSVALIVSPLASLMIDQKFRSRRKRSGVCGVTDSYFRNDFSRSDSNVRFSLRSPLLFALCKRRQLCVFCARTCVCIVLFMYVRVLREKLGNVLRSYSFAGLLLITNCSRSAIHVV